MSDRPELIFVYNADDGFFNALSDTAHKIFSPETYACSLCRFTYGLVGMVRPWKRFLDELALPTKFYHRREFREAYPEIKDALPLILLRRPGEAPEILVDAATIGATGGVEMLMRVVRERLSERV